MSSLVVGYPVSQATSANAKVLRRQEYNREPNGLESITETYTIQTSNRITINPAKDVTHQAFSTASQKYPRMAVETTSFSELDGGISELTVNYVGLTSSSGLPPALARILPVTGAGVFGPPINIEAEFITDALESEIVIGKLSSTAPIIPKGTASKQRMPKFINGIKMPENPIEPFSRSKTTGFVAGSAVSVTDVVDRYEGYVIKDVDCVRRGQFLVARITFEEYRLFTIVQ
jgi:hypothetical protein